MFLLKMDHAHDIEGVWHLMRNNCISPNNQNLVAFLGTHQNKERMILKIVLIGCKTKARMPTLLTRQDISVHQRGTNMTLLASSASLMEKRKVSHQRTMLMILRVGGI